LSRSGTKKKKEMLKEIYLLTRPSAKWDLPFHRVSFLLGVYQLYKRGINHTGRRVVISLPHQLVCTNGDRMAPLLLAICLSESVSCSINYTTAFLVPFLIPKTFLRLTRRHIRHEKNIVILNGVERVFSTTAHNLKVFCIDIAKVTQETAF
jgi:hypothetical protein